MTLSGFLEFFGLRRARIKIIIPNDWWFLWRLVITSGRGGVAAGCYAWRNPEVVQYDDLNQFDPMSVPKVETQCRHGTAARSMRELHGRHEAPHLRASDVFSAEGIATVPLYATANLLLTFCPGDKDWWEYLDQIWDAAAVADRTSLTVLPALMLRARKQSNDHDGHVS